VNTFRNVKKETSKPFGVNVPMLYPNIEEIMKIIVEGVKIVLLRQESKNVDSLFKRKWYYRSTCGQQYPICIKSAKCGC
jgi:dTDP-glucose pyrophosphorylase